MCNHYATKIELIALIQAENFYIALNETWLDTQNKHLLAEVAIHQSINQSINISLIQKGTLQGTSKIFLQLYMIKTDLLTCHQDLVRGGCIYNLLTKTIQ